MKGSYLATLVVALSVAVSEALYVYKGNPFHPGPLQIGTRVFTEEKDGIPVRSQVYYPVAPGIYSPVLFIPGLNGVVPAEIYSTVISKFASYGYIVTGIDLYWPPLLLEDKLIKRDNPKKIFAVLQWLADNLSGVLAKEEGAFNVTADWRNLGLFSHSLGADSLILSLQENETFAKAVAFLEPASTNFKAPLGYSIPALSYGTQLCMEKPRCCLKGFSYFHFYDDLSCPKILMNVTGYGHCDIVDEVPGWDACHLIGICKTDKSNNRVLYREVFLPGVLASFFGSFLQGNTDLEKYITTRDLMPVPLGQLEFELNC